MSASIERLIEVAAVVPRGTDQIPAWSEAEESVSPGDVVWFFSRGNWRRGLVEKIARTGTVTVAYVSPGGIDHAHSLHNMYAPGSRIARQHLRRDATPEDVEAYRAEQYAKPWTEWLNVTRKAVPLSGLRVPVS